MKRLNNVKLAVPLLTRCMYRGHAEGQVKRSGWEISNVLKLKSTFRLE